MGKIYKRYTHNGRTVKEETDSSIPRDGSPSIDEQNSLIGGTEIVTGNKSNPPKEQIKKENVQSDMIPDTFQEHFGTYIQQHEASTTPHNNEDTPKQDTNEPPPAPIRRKETYEEQASALGFKDLPTNLAHSLMSWTKTGRPVVTSEQWNARLTICRECQFWSENKTTNHAKCMKCGCGSGKLLLTQSKCPLNPPKWTSL